MTSRILGAVLLIIGTCVGGGILALPMVTAGLNGATILALLISVWIVMTLSAMLIVELNLNLQGYTNLISMAKVTLGRTGVIFTWLIYLLLLYALLSLYLAGGTDLTKGLLALVDVHISNPLATLLFLVLFAAILYRGITWVDWSNRGLMSVKFLTFFILLIVLLPFDHESYLNWGADTIKPVTAIMPIVFSFGFGIIVPSLVIYLSRNRRAIRSAVLIGSLFPLLAYIAWIFSVSGSVSLPVLKALVNSPDSISGLALSVSQATSSHSVSFLVHLFTTICITTSFLGVSISLLDFLTDGLHLKKVRHTVPWRVMALAFLPPLLIILLNPGIFIILLKYAGTLCVLLLILLPTAMAWSARYWKKIMAQPPFYSHWLILLANALAGFFLLYLAAKDIF